MRIYVDYEQSLRCRILQDHDQGSAEHGCQGGFKPVFGKCARFCLCPCHEGEQPKRWWRR